ncbi:MAG: Ribosomal protein S6 modification protein [Deltaproteobacteria bacterium ADurb.Bin510]|nr:MAG: Ribosomal protein S6 modification protein [Deltaproteobacteria bacterium ADurb.Bin510]
MRAAERLGLCPELIDRDAIARLVEFDALFIRETTNVNHPSYRCARKAEAEGLVVIDDPLSILRCNNKVYLAEMLRRHRLPTPQTFTVHHRNRQEVLSRLQAPIVLKQPDSAFSKGVIKAETTADFMRITDELLEKSALIIAQEYLPTSFDWRIGIIDRRPLFACKYYMAPGHWQIYRREGGQTLAGDYEAVALERVPARVLRLALKAAEPVGAGFYGVDIKEAGGRLAVIEINDNPSVESEVEDGVAGAELYLTVMRVFLERIERRKTPRCRS